MNRIELEKKIINIVAEQVGADVEDITPASSFIADLGFDSLDVVEVTMSIEDEFGIDITDEDAEKLANVKFVVDYVTKKYPIEE